MTMEVAQTETAAPASTKPKGIGEYLSSHLRQYGLLFALIAVMVFFATLVVAKA